MIILFWLARMLFYKSYPECMQVIGLMKQADEILDVLYACHTQSQEILRWK
mgnify:CR=1 FL=1